MATLEELTASVTSMNTKVDALIALTDTLKADLVKLIAGGGATPDQLQALKNALDAETVKIDAAVTADAPPPLV